MSSIVPRILPKPSEAIMSSITPRILPKRSEAYCWVASWAASCRSLSTMSSILLLGGLLGDLMQELGDHVLDHAAGLA